MEEQSDVEEGQYKHGKVTHFAVTNVSSIEIPVSEAPTTTIRALICTCHGCEMESTMLHMY